MNPGESRCGRCPSVSFYDMGAPLKGPVPSSLSGTIKTGEVWEEVSGGFRLK